MNETRTAPKVIVVGLASTLPTAAVHAAQSSLCRTSLIGAILIGEPGSDDLHAQLPFAGGLPTLGGLEALPDLAEVCGVTHAIVCIPQAMSRLAQTVSEALASHGITERRLPTADDLLQGTPPGIASTALDLQSLVGRPAREIDHDLIDAVVRNKRVLITGAGGSIGSELARICAAHEPASIILMDRSDSALFEIDRCLRERFPQVKRITVLHDVVDATGTRRRLEALLPGVIFHAAAHKHVPLMQDHPAEAIRNNLLGTKSVADAALAINAERFVLISTDKAVNPSSVMGATKRLAEQYVRSLNVDDAPGVASTRFTLVRFGNVLGSTASVLPIWKSQIEAGGPVTLTDERMTRYFMTIPEAAALVIQSAGLPQPEGDVFVLDMGQPVAILDLAKRFIRAQGLTPLLESTGDQPRAGEPSVRIAITGVRPGEKLYEELSYDAEELTPTSVPGVQSWAGPRPTEATISGMLTRVRAALETQDRIAVLDLLASECPNKTLSTPAAITKGVRPESKSRAEAA